MPKYLVTENQYHKYLQSRKRQIISEDYSDDDPFIYKLVLFMKGRITEAELIDGEDLIDRIQDGNVIFSYNSSYDFFKSISMGENNATSLSAFLNGYYDYTPYDYSETDESWNEGHIVRIFNTENEEILFDILGRLGQYEKDYENASKEFKKYFPSETESISEEYISTLNYSAELNAKKEFIGELKADLEKCGVDVIYSFYKFSISLDTLLDKLTSNIDVGNFEDALKVIFKELDFENFDFWESLYESSYKPIDEDLLNDFNKFVNHRLSNIISEFDDGKFDDLLELRARLPKKFNFGRWYKLPKDPSLKFKINSLDAHELKVNYSVKSSGDTKYSEGTSYSKTIDNFLNFLYQPELF